jgi:Family of unknown function (DUF5302)
MTKSAKQDTTKAPAGPAETEAAETESAATQATDAQATDAQATEAQAADAEATDAEVTEGEATEAGAEAADGEDKPDLDETKRKFREALERKHQAHNDGQGSGGRDGSKISSAHGPAASRRSFRRKSG